MPEASTERVLVVDDEPTIRDLVGTALRYVGYDVEVADAGEEAIRRAHVFEPDLIVLDVMLPDIDGFEVTRRLRRDGAAMPVVFLTARDATEDKVNGLTIGGDDYVTKPFSLDELVARIRTVLRRTAGAARGSRLVFADLELDEDSYEVWRGGESISLTVTEFNLLRYLLLHPRQVLSRTQILDHVWRYDFDGDPNVVETYVSYLRRKLDRHGDSLIHTVRGVGYVLRQPG